MKICKKCNTEKDDEQFPPQRRTCRECRNQQHKRWHVANRDHKREKDRQYRKDNPQRKNEAVKRWLARPGQKQLNYRLGKRLRCRLNQALNCHKKSDKAFGLLGCTIEFFRQHIERQFLPGMVWENWGKKGWHIDHKRPCASFDLTEADQQKVCFHYSNLQPLWAEDNLLKGDR